MMITIKLRLRDKHAAELNRQARAVNFVWNFCNETLQKAARWNRRWPSGYDLQKLTTGSARELNVSAQTIYRVCTHYDHARRARRKPWLRWRGRRSLGWVPFDGREIKLLHGALRFRGIEFVAMHWRSELTSVSKIASGSFNADSRGRWYINLPVEAECATSAPISRVGIDLGLKELACLSTGEKIRAPRLYRASEARLAAAQRARKTKRARAIHAKIANRRRDFLHRVSAKITKEHGLIVVGDVSPKQIAQTRFAKSSLDAGWSDFKRMLSYKSIRNGGSTLEVSERYSSQVCSECGSLPLSRPRGIADLGIREWSCDCGAVHDRDVNAARNILRIGLDALVAGAAKSGAVDSRGLVEPLTAKGTAAADGGRGG